VAADLDTESIVRRKVAVLRAELAGVTGQVRRLEATVGERDAELAQQAAEATFLRNWAEGAERHALSEQQARETAQQARETVQAAREKEVAHLQGQLEQVQEQLAALRRSVPVRAARAVKRVVRLGR